MEPNMEAAMAIGVENESTADTVYSITPSDMIKTLPGVTFRNHRYVMSNVPSMRALVNLSAEELVKLLGTEAGTSLYEFINYNPRA
jgi:DNA excision repair protein ERCC-4